MNNEQTKITLDTDTYKLIMSRLLSNEDTKGIATLLYLGTEKKEEKKASPLWCAVHPTSPIRPGYKKCFYGFKLDEVCDLRTE